MVLSKLNIQKLVSQHTRGRYTFQPLWVSAPIYFIPLEKGNAVRPNIIGARKKLAGEGGGGVDLKS